MAQEKEYFQEGFTIYDKKHTDELLVDPLFLKAKKGDRQAAFDLIHKIWTPEKTEQVRLMTKDHPTFFISVPGTSRQNQIPPVYAEFLAELTDQSFLVSDEYIASLHSTMMKSVKNGDRLMRPRMYEPLRKDFFKRLKEAIGDKQVVLVEDILTTGASVNCFRRFLEKNGIAVKCVFGLKGDSNIAPSLSEIMKLQKIAQREGITIDMEKLGKELSKSEVISLTYQYIAERYKQSSDKIKTLMNKQLLCLYDIRVNQNLQTALKLDMICSIIQKENEQEEKNGKTTDEKNSSNLLLFTQLKKKSFRTN